MAKKRSPKTPRSAAPTPPAASAKAAAPSRTTSAQPTLTGEPARARTGGRPSRRRQRAPLPWILGLGGLALLVAVQIGVNMVREANAPGERFPSQGNTHIALDASTPAYNSDPPTSGWHNASLAPWGSHVDLLHDQRLIHNMEDGGIILWYANGTPEENEAHVTALEAVATGRYDRIVIAPRNDMPSTYALTAWQRLQRFDEIDEVAMREFIAAYHGIDNH